MGHGFTPILDRHVPFSRNVIYSHEDVVLKNKVLKTESSLGKTLLLLVTLRNWLFKPSIAFVVYIMRLITSGYCKKTTKFCQLFCHDFAMCGYCLPHFKSKSDKAASASSSVIELYTNFKSAASSFLSL